MLDFAAAPVRSQRGNSSVPHAGRRKVSVITESSAGLALEKSVCRGDRDSCHSSAVSLIQKGRRILLAGFPIEDVADMCSRHNYRWRVRHGEPSVQSLRFIIEPGKGSEADAKEV